MGRLARQDVLSRVAVALIGLSLAARSSAAQLGLPGLVKNEAFASRNRDAPPRAPPQPQAGSDADADFPDATVFLAMSEQLHAFDIPGVGRSGSPDSSAADRMRRAREMAQAHMRNLAMPSWWNPPSDADDGQAFGSPSQEAPGRPAAPPADARDASGEDDGEDGVGDEDGADGAPVGGLTHSLRELLRQRGFQHARPPAAAAGFAGGQQQRSMLPPQRLQQAPQPRYQQAQQGEAPADPRTHQAMLREAYQLMRESPAPGRMQQQRGPPDMLQAMDHSLAAQMNGRDASPEEAARQASDDLAAGMAGADDMGGFDDSEAMGGPPPPPARAGLAAGSGGDPFAGSLPPPAAPHFQYSPLSGNSARPAPPPDPPAVPRAGAPPTEGMFPLSSPVSPSISSSLGGGGGGGGGDDRSLDPSYAPLPVSDGGDAALPRFQATSATLSPQRVDTPDVSPTPMSAGPQDVATLPLPTLPPGESPVRARPSDMLQSQ